MPKIRTLRTKKAPEGFEDIEPVLDELQQKMTEATNESHEGKRKNEALWPIMRIHHQQSRYIYELFYRKKAISRDLYDWLVAENYCDVNLIGKWRKPGYERLCCLKCIQAKDHNYGGTCICRVPRGHLKAGKVIECQHCGCRGCASGDQHSVLKKEGADLKKFSFNKDGGEQSNQQAQLTNGNDPYGGQQQQSSSSSSSSSSSINAGNGNGQQTGNGKENAKKGDESEEEDYDCPEVLPEM